jgi:Sec-independent protein translocase protein TatA
MGGLVFLSPVKLLVILVVALAVLGPDSLPKVARQIGGFWGALQGLRRRLESEARHSIPDLPSAETIARVVRSPLGLLDHLADDLATTPSSTAAERETTGAPAATRHEVRAGAAGQPEQVGMN